MNNHGFWKNLRKGFTLLAPMEDVTDTVFRQIILEIGKPDVMFTEFTSAEGMISEKGWDKVSHRLKFTEAERPLVAQIWGKTPEAYHLASKRIVEMGFDGVDINMGCPVKKVIQQGSCSALIKNPTLAAEIISATKEGASSLPVSVKTRIGFSEVNTEEWISFLLNQGINALTVHGRIATELSKKPADWQQIQKSVTLRDNLSPDTIIIGNGDVKDLTQVELYVKQFGVDGVMIGRGVFENPWVFNRNINEAPHSPILLLELMKKHIKLFVEIWGDKKNYDILKKFFKIYIKGYDGAATFRTSIMEMQDPLDIIEAVDLEIARISNEDR